MRKKENVAKLLIVLGTLFIYLCFSLPDLFLGGAPSQAYEGAALDLVGGHARLFGIVGALLDSTGEFYAWMFVILLYFTGYVIFAAAVLMELARIIDAKLKYGDEDAEAKKAREEKILLRCRRLAIAGIAFSALPIFEGSLFHFIPLSMFIAAVAMLPGFGDGIRKLIMKL